MLSSFITRKIERIMSYLKKYLLAGVLVWFPLGITMALLIFLVNFFDRSLLLLPPHLHPQELLGFDLPGFGLLFSFIIILVTGMLVANFFGRYIYKLGEKLLSRIPIVRSIYTAVKQISEAVFGNSTQTFKKAFLIQYPRTGLWTLAFQTSTIQGEAQIKTELPKVVNLFVPTTPNPTSGFFIMAEKSEVIELEMSVDEALKMVISGGVVVPEWAKKKTKKQKQKTKIEEKNQTIEGQEKNDA